MCLTPELSRRQLTLGIEIFRCISLSTLPFFLHSHLHSLHMASVLKPPCVVCKTPSVTRCSRCKVVHYCSAACQRKDWPSHKIACTPSTVPSSSSSKGTPPTSSSTNNNKQPTLPDPSKVLNVTEPAPNKSGKPSLQKPAPQKSSTSLKFKYIPSIDNVDENLVIFFHGLGDKIEPNFTKLAKSLQLPQTAAVCIQAPTPVPYLEEEGYQWFPSFNNLTGDCMCLFTFVFFLF